jgi:hypothetical protein
MSNTINIIRPPKAPNLPIGPVDYTQRYQDQFLNILRLYFNTIDNSFGALLSEGGGRYLTLPHIAASDSTDQYATGNEVPTQIKWNTLDSGQGFVLSPPGAATSNENTAGIFRITYSAQLANTTNAPHDATFWLKINGFDVPNSATRFTIPARKSAGVPSYVCGYSEATFQINGGDTVELYWATELAATSGGGAGIYIFHDAAQTVPYPRPAIPSMIGSITFVSSTGT